MRLRCLVIVLALLAAFASDLWGQSLPAPQVQTEQKAGESPPGQAKRDAQNSKVEPASVATPSPSPDHSDEKPTAEKTQSSKEVPEGTEYWDFHGYKVKITDGLLVLFTLGLVVIGVFQAVFLSGTLKATAVAATAADLSARAAVAIELPIIRADPSKLVFGWNMDVEPDNPRSDWCSITYLNFYNGGRTKAFPIEIRCGWAVGDKLPDVPIYTNAQALPVNFIFEPNNSEEPDQVRIDHFKLKLAPGFYEEVRSNAVSLWFYCSIVYLDFMQTRHEAGFCWKRHEMIGSGGFLADPTPAYNQKT